MLNPSALYPYSLVTTCSGNERAGEWNIQEWRGDILAVERVEGKRKKERKKGGGNETTV
jgi:hypothetical protein